MLFTGGRAGRCLAQVGTSFMRTAGLKNLSCSPKDTANNSPNNYNDSTKKSVAEVSLDRIDEVPDIGFGSKVNKGKGDSTRPLYIPETENPDPVDLEPPTNCCMSGCPNCVWLEYAEALTKCLCKSDASKERIRKELDAITDQNVKAFIMMELRIRGLL